MRMILITIGFSILVAGSQVNWLFVGAAAFVLTRALLLEFAITQSEWQLIIFSMVGGVIGIFLAYYLRKVIVVLASFLAGAYIIATLPANLGMEQSWVNWTTIFLGGLVCAAMVIAWYELPLILVSTLAGATLILQNMSFGSIREDAIFVLLLLFGIVVQWILMQYGRPDAAEV